MKALLAAGLVAFSALAVLPSVQASDPAFQPPPPCYGAEAAWACPSPACKEQQVDETDVLAVLNALGPWGWVYTGPNFGARLDSDCTVDAWATWADGFDCESNLLPLVYQEQTVDTRPVDATVLGCGVGFICACMPAEIGSAGAKA
jgi:hypothetical protein